MHDRPTALELVEAVREFLVEELVPAVEDPRLRFRTLVAVNALGIAGRELTEGDEGPSTTELAELARHIRAGEPPADAVATLKAHIASKLRISNPAYLERYERR